MIEFKSLDTRHVEAALFHDFQVGDTTQGLQIAIEFLQQVAANPYSPIRGKLPAIPADNSYIDDGQPSIFRKPGSPEEVFEMPFRPEILAKRCMVMANRLLDEIEGEGSATKAKLVGTAVSFGTTFLEVLNWYNGHLKGILADKAAAEKLAADRAKFSASQAAKAKNTAKLTAQEWVEVKKFLVLETAKGLSNTRASELASSQLATGTFKRVRRAIVISPHTLRKRLTAK